MNKFLKMAILSFAAIASASAPMSQAFARGPYGPGPGPGPYYGGDGYYAPPPPPPPYRHHSKRRDHSDAIAAGVIGLAAGAIIGGALSQPARPNVVYQAPPPPPAYYPAQPQPVYQQPRPIYQPQPVYRGLDPWTPGWYDYCSRKYRTFNSQTGTFRGYDGRDHFCNVP
ncbi:BA14K family protein [Bartonella sp. HY406]|uniref:BA14K family protein n=1 Tax=Bartonella sp. HY406 TaxID=2979331 RepID=UPI0021C5D746|nr:BA14K family protein [Bartonella sp. HY406]UXN04343.1 BA14K family protein [Bartonella sp. HY406]